jgi:phosphate transport system substrate-binding protein
MAKKIKKGIWEISLVVILAISLLCYKIYLDHNTNSTQTYNNTLLFKLSGSNTIGDSLTPELVKVYLENNKYSNVSIVNIGKNEKSVLCEMNSKKYRVDISAHGTSTGFSDLGKNADICMASSPSTNNSFTEHVIGLDGIAIVANVSIQQLTIKNLKDIFSGNIKNWQEIKNSHKSGNINIYRLDDNSGTTKMFSNIVMNGEKFTPSKLYENGNNVLSNLVKDNNGIGYISFSQINNKIKVIPISVNDDLSAMIPNTLTIQTEKYPICRRLYFYTSSNTNDTINDFINFVESNNGQNIIQKFGLINLTINDDKPVVANDDPLEYKQLIKTCTKLSTELHFNFASQELDSRASNDIDRIVERISKNKNNKLILVGFTDNVGDKDKNVVLSLLRAQTVEKILKMKGAEIKDVIGLGSSRPLNNNSTEEERSNNRRVEIWISNN